MSKNTYSDLLTRRAHTQTHTHTHKMKRNPESLLDPRSHGERQAGGLEFGGVPDRRRKCMLRPSAPDKGRWSGPQSHVGTRGSWQSSGGEQSGSTEGGQGRSVLP